MDVRQNPFVFFGPEPEVENAHGLNVRSVVVIVVVNSYLCDVSETSDAH